MKITHLVIHVQTKILITEIIFSLIYTLPTFFLNFLNNFLINSLTNIYVYTYIISFGCLVFNIYGWKNISQFKKYFQILMLNFVSNLSKNMLKLNHMMSNLTFKCYKKAI